MPSALDQFKINTKYKLYKSKYPFKPVFLIGCGRSGTTILGHILGNHPKISYLNERRDIWNKAYPEFDIWSGNQKDPMLIVDENQHYVEKTKLLKRELHVEQVVAKSTVLLEKLPINNFRLPFLKAAFPEARYIYLHRNGLEVGRSIERISAKGGWYGKSKSKSKWVALKHLIESQTDFKPEELTFYQKALLEWQFSMSFSETFFDELEPDQFYSLSYTSLLDSPEIQIQHIFDFLHLHQPTRFIKELAKRIERKTGRLDEITAEDQLYGGPYLKGSVQNALRQS